VKAALGDNCIREPRGHKTSHELRKNKHGKGTGPKPRWSGERKRQVADRILGASGEIAIATVSAALVAVCVWAGIEAGALHDGRLAGFLAALLSPFALICVWCMRKAVRRWREVAEVQRMLGGMDESERAEFEEAVSQGDVEVSVDENGKRHFHPVEFG